MTIDYFSESDYGIHHDYRVGIGKDFKKKRKARNKTQSLSRKSNRKR